MYKLAAILNTSTEQIVDVIDTKIVAIACDTFSQDVVVVFTDKGVWFGGSMLSDQDWETSLENCDFVIKDIDSYNEEIKEKDPDFDFVFSNVFTNLSFDEFIKIASDYFEDTYDVADKNEVYEIGDTYYS